MLTLTIVRHGESTDNLKPLWAGWSDAPLSVHGMNQAKALGESFAPTHVDEIFCSDLLRAHWTAQQIERNHATPKPPLTTSSLLREQNFGLAEHKPFGERGEGVYVRKPGRTFKFPEGESLEDVRARANEAISQFIEPALQASAGQPPSSRHVVVVAHGIFNSEFIGALLARQVAGRGLDWGYKGMTNTGWTRLEVGYASETPPPPPSTPSSSQSNSNSNSNPNSVLRTSPSGPQSPSSEPQAPPPANPPIAKRLPPLTVRILCSDVTRHLDGVHRQKGGIGSQAHDDTQKTLKNFFGGGGG